MARNIRNNLRTVSLVLSFLFLFQIAFFNNFQAYASTQPKISYSINGSPEVGQTIDIVVNATNAQNLYGSSVDFQYDTNLLQVLSVEKGSIYGSNSTETPVSKVENGQVNLASMMKGNRSGISGTGSIAVIKAKVLKEGTLNLKTTNGNGTLSTSGNTVRVKLADNNGKAINYSQEDNSVKFIGGPLSAILVSENIPDVMQPGSTYDVSLTFKNTGTETWTAASNHRLGLDYVSNSSYGAFGLKGRYDLNSNEAVRPGETVTFSISMKAPTAEGSYSLNFKMLKEGNSWFGDMVSKNIQVKTVPLNSQLVSENIPTTMESGKSYNVSLTFKNIGKETWSAANKHRLGLDYISSSTYKQFGIGGRVDIGSNVSVKPGDTVTFSMVLTAPAESGQYSLDFKMLKEGTAWFGPTVTKNITINPAVSTNPLDYEVISENIPATMESGQSYNVSFKVKNTGSETWSEANKHRLGLDYVDGSHYGSFGLTRRVDLGSNISVKPGEIATFNMVMKAPVAAGKYNLNLKMLKEGVAWFGPTVDKTITVNNATPLNAELVSENLPATMEAGKSYNVSLTFRNTGGETWTADTKHRLGLDYVSGSNYSSFGVGGRVDLGSDLSVKSGETATFTLTLKAPAAAGNYSLNFKMLKEGTSWFGPTLSKTVQVNSSTPTTPLEAELVSENIPTNMEPGQAYKVSLKFRNNGSETWTASNKHRLGLDYISGSSYKSFGIGGRVDLGSNLSVKPGETATFEVMLKAPTTNGNYSLNFKMLKEGTAWFGPTISKRVSVGNATYNSEIVSNNIPATMTAGQTYNVSITVKNTGTHPWNDLGNYRLGLDSVSGSQYGSFGLAGRVYLNSNDIINPGETITFNMTMKAPTKTGNYSFNFKMLKEGVTWFGPTLNKSVTVK